MLQLLFDFFGGKAKTRLYSTFLGWLLLFHIDILFVAITIDQEFIYKKFNLLKGEYLLSYITNYGYWTLIIELSRIVLAALTTYLMIWIIPKLLSERAYKVELETEYKLRKMKVEKEDILNKKEKKVVKEQLENIEAEKKVVVQRARLEDSPKELRWDKEFDEFMKINNSKQSLEEIKHNIYAEGGNLYQYTGANGWLETPKGVGANNLALADTNDLVQFSDKGKLLTLTEKGKYFLKKLDSLS